MKLKNRLPKSCSKLFGDSENKKTSTFDGQVCNLAKKNLTTFDAKLIKLS